MWETQWVTAASSPHRAPEHGVQTGASTKCARANGTDKVHERAKIVLELTAGGIASTMPCPPKHETPHAPTHSGTQGEQFVTPV